MEAKDRNPADPTHDPRDLAQQMVISIVFGLSAFLAFCVRVWIVFPGGGG